MYLLLSTKRTNILARNRHDFWAQNVLKMLLRFGSSQRSPETLAGFGGPLRGRESMGTGRGGRVRESRGSERIGEKGRKERRKRGRVKRGGS